jgi:hypothetical protein
MRGVAVREEQADRDGGAARQRAQTSRSARASGSTSRPSGVDAAAQRDAPGLRREPGRRRRRGRPLVGVAARLAAEVRGIGEARRRDQRDRRALAGQQRVGRQRGGQAQPRDLGRRDPATRSASCSMAVVVSPRRGTLAKTGAKTGSAPGAVATRSRNAPPMSQATS